jgi:hypothetical protein
MIFDVPCESRQHEAHSSENRTHRRRRKDLQTYVSRTFQDGISANAKWAQPIHRLALGLLGPCDLTVKDDSAAQLRLVHLHAPLAPVSPQANSRSGLDYLFPPRR